MTQPQATYERRDAAHAAFYQAQRDLEAARQELAASKQGDELDEVRAQVRVRRAEDQLSAAQSAARQADEAAQRQQTIDWRAEGKRLRAAHEQTESAQRARMEALAAEMRAVQTEAATEDQRYRAELDAHLAAAAHLPDISWQERDVHYLRDAGIYAFQLGHFEYGADGNKVMMRA